MPTLTVIIGSTRPGRAGRPIAQWFAGEAARHGGFDVELVDLAELDLPLMDEPHHPRLRRYTQTHTLRWSSIVDRSDAIVLVTPEYNHGYPAALKNAIDYLHEEWRDRPVGFVSYGGVSAGTRAVQQLKPVVMAVGMMPVAASVSIPFHTQFLSEGEVHPNDAMTGAASGMLDELARLEVALRPLREEHRRAA